VAEPPPGLDRRTDRECRWLIRYQLKPWEVQQLPLGTYRWLDSMASCIQAIENSH
jgi:hypothetical protein